MISTPKLRRSLFTVGLAALLSITGLYAQTSTLSGVISDVTGKGISNAAVTIKNEAGGSDKQVAADSQGKFTATGLAQGTYTVVASAPSFSSGRKTGIVIGAGKNESVSIALNISELAQSITVEGAVSVAAETAISQNSLDARSARSEISPEYIQNFASPIADYTELLNNAPGTFSVNPNGVGLGDSKTYFRGFKDGQYTMQADGVPFNDTNDPTHHSWAFFPSQFISGVDFDRSPGSAASVGPTNFGGTVNLLSRSISYSPDIRATVSYGSFDTRMVALDADSGQFGPGKRSTLTLNVHQLLSSGYQTDNNQKRDAGFLKYQYRVTNRSYITVFSGVVNLRANTPNLKGPSRAQVAAYGDNYLLSGDPAAPNFFPYNYYHVQTDFNYIAYTNDIGKGWKLENKVYTYRYWNKQNYNNPSLNATTGFFDNYKVLPTNSAVDKLNGYRKVGDITQLSWETRRGVLRTGLWFEWAYTDRYQIPSTIPYYINAALPNFHEHFITTSAQPYIEYEYKVTRKLSVTAGIKVAQYGMYLDQFADNGKTVGNLNGAASVYHDANYRSWLPSLDARYRVRSNWTMYAQFGTGTNIPPSSVFDSKGAQVAVLPKPTGVKTYQIGSVYKQNRFTLDVDAYYSHFQNPYSSYLDAAGESYFYQTGPSNTKGIEAEGNYLIGHGFSIYVNATAGSAKYQKDGTKYYNGGQWVANTPKSTEAVGLTYQKKNFDIGFTNKRVGPMYNDNGTINQAVNIDPFIITNLFFNYTFKGDTYLRGTKIKFGINNLFDQHSITGVALASKTTATGPADILTLVAARSMSITMTFGYAPKF